MGCSTNPPPAAGGGGGCRRRWWSSSWTGKRPSTSPTPTASPRRGCVAHPSSVHHSQGVGVGGHRIAKGPPRLPYPREGPPPPPARTPLCVASSQGRLDLVDHLVLAGAAVDHPDHGGLTPLHIAAPRGTPPPPPSAPRVPRVDMEHTGLHYNQTNTLGAFKFQKRSAGFNFFICFPSSMSHFHSLRF